MLAELRERADDDERIRIRDGRALDPAEHLGTAPAPPQVVEAAVVDDPVQPGRLGLRRLERGGQLPVRLQERVLQDVVHATRVPEHPVGDAAQPRLVAVEQVLEAPPR